MASTKKTQVVITANATVAKKIMDELNQRVESLKRQMNALDVTTKKGQKEFNRLKNELVSYNSAINQNITNTEILEQALKDLSGTSLRDLKRALSAAKSELNKMSESSPELKQKRKDIATLQTQIEKVTGAVKKQGKEWNTAMKNMVAYVGLFSVFHEAQALLQGLIQKNFEYSGSLTDIRKVSGLAQEDISKLSRMLAKIETRTTTNELAQLAYEGSKLGMSDFGVEGLAGFVRAADQIKVAIGEEMGDGALSAVSKIVEVMGLVPKMGIEQAMLSAGSAMFALSASSTATSENIVEFAKRLTGVSRTAGITIDQLLALGSASDSMMLMPEVSSTAMSKFIVSLQQKHNLIEKDLGLEKGIINSYYEQGRAMDAVVLILEKMKKMGNMNMLGDIFKDFGSDGQRLISAMVTMSKNVDMLKDHLVVANEAFAEGTAVTDEYKMQQESAIGILERANNLWVKAFINPEGVDKVKSLAQVWYDCSKALTENAAAMGTLQAAFTLMLTVIKALVYVLPALIAGLTFKGISAIVITVKNALIGMGEASFIAAIQVKGLAGAWRGLNAAMKANWISLVIGLLVELGVAVYDFFKTTDEATEKQKTLNDYVREGGEAWDKERRKLDSYVRALENSNASVEQRADVLRKFNKEYRPYLEKLGLEINSVDSLKRNYSALNEEISKKFYYQMREKAYEDKLAPIEGDMRSALMEYSKFINSETGAAFKAFDTNYVVDLIHKGFNTSDIVRSITTGGFKLGGKNDQSGKPKKGGANDRDESLVLNPEGKKNKLLPNAIDMAKRSKFGYSANQKHDAQTVRELTRLIGAIRTYEARRNSEKDIIDQTFNPLVKDYNPLWDDPLGSLSNDEPDKEAIIESKRIEREKKRDAREQLKAKQDESNAIIDNVSNYFDRQINAQLEQAIAQGSLPTERDFLVEPLKIKKDAALSQVRLAIAGRRNSWDSMLKELPKYKVEKDDETGFNMSDQLLSDIGRVNIPALRESMLKFSSYLKVPFNSVIAEIFAKATKNQQDNLKLNIKQQDARRKAAQEQDYISLVQQKHYEDFNTMGYANPTDAEMTNEKARDERRARILQMFENARLQIEKLTSLDVAEEDGQGKLLEILFGDDPDKTGQQISQTLGKNAEDWRAFYYKLIQYVNEYGEAVDKYRKRGTDLFEDKGHAPNGFLQETDESRTIDRYVAMQKMLGAMRFDKKTGTAKTTSFGKDMSMSMGFSFNQEDPEIEQLRLKYEKEREIYEQFYAMYKRDEMMASEIQKKKQSMLEAGNAYIEKISSQQKEQVNTLMNLLAPVQQFGWAAGEAFSTMMNDAKEGKKQVKEALKSMTNSFIQSTLEIIKQNLMRQLNTQMTYANIETMQAAHSAAMVAGETAGGQALNVAQTANNSTSLATEAAATQGRVALQSPSIIAKCFAELGPIGGPIAIAGIMAVISAALSFALNAAFGAGKKKNTANVANAKIVSGMLTYDSGNVQELKPYVSRDGGVYWATEDHEPNKSGVRVLSTPTATSINGQPALVAENGPEIVIGRETTQAMMMNNPALLKALVSFDKNHSGRRAFDAGNVGETVGNLAAIGGVSDSILAETAASNSALLQAISVLMKRLEQPLQAKIDMYGRGNLYESMTKANQFMKNKS